MSTFNEREKGFEAKFQHDQETAFKVTTRRNKMLALWAAQHMGLSGAEAEDYAKTAVVADMTRPIDEHLVQKLLKDMKAKGVSITEHRIRAEMEALLPIARRQITGK